MKSGFLIGLAAAAATTCQAADAPVEFARDLLPVFRRNCLACHNATKAKADLNLESPALIRKGGENGPAAVPGKSGESLVFKSAAHTADEVMPPRNNKVNAVDLTPDELALLRRWIDEGAADGSSAAPAVPPPAFRPTPAGSGGVTAVAFSPAGRTLAAARGRRVDLYDPATGLALVRLVDPALGEAGGADVDGVLSMAISRDGVIATGGFRAVRIWRGPAEQIDPATRAALEVDAAKSLQAACTQRLQAAAERAKNDQAAAAAAAAAVAQADAQWSQAPANPAASRKRQDARTNLDVATRLASQAAAVHSAAQTAQASAEARVREAVAIHQAPPVEIPPFCGPPRPWHLVRTIGAIDDPSLFADRVTALGFSPDGLYLATGGGIPSREGEVKIWDIATGTLVTTVKNPHSDTVNAVQFSPDGSLLATGGADRSLRVWNAVDGSPVASFDGHAGAVLSVTWRADGQYLASAGADKTLRVWDLMDKKQVRSVTNWNREVSVASFIGAGDTVLAASGDASVRLGDQALPGATGFVLCGASDPAGAYAAAGTHDGTVRWWSIKDRKLLFQVGHE